VLVLLLAGCGTGSSPQKLSGQTMGTTWSVTYLQGDATATTQAIHALITQRLEAINASMSTYRDDSELMRFNQLAVGQAFRLSSDLREVLAAALIVGQASGGAYDVTVGPLVDLWGFGASGPHEGIPSAADIEAGLKQVGQQFLQLDDTGTLRKTATVQIDLSSIAKGYGVDAVAQLLEDAGIADYLAEVGGEMRLSGVSPRGDDWRVAIEAPDPRQRSVALAFSATDIAVATSGDYRNFFEVDGQRYSHSIDARTGWPVRHDLVSVTVLHESAMWADAWATALTVLGPDLALSVAQQQGLAVYLIRREADALAVEYSPAFAPYLPSDPVSVE
jgi:thiamine biosynthesis lipoprotein